MKTVCEKNVPTVWLATVLWAFNISVVHAQAGGADVEQAISISPATALKIMDCARANHPRDGLDPYRSGAPILVERGHSVYGLELRGFYWAKERFVLQVAAPEVVARMFIPEDVFNFTAVAPAITEVRCRE